MPSFLWPAVHFVQAVFFALWTGGWILTALVVRAFSRDAVPALAMARRCWAPGLLWGGGVRLEVEGLENVDWTRPHFFAANHQSMVDAVALFRVLPVPLLFILKAELRRVPLLGWYVSAMGMIFVPRDQRRQSLENLRQCRHRIDCGYSILMFPEGTRSRDQRIGPFKPGIFLPAIDSETPIVPVVLDGPGRILPRGSFRIRPGTVRVAIGRPVATDGLGRGDRRALAEQVREEMLATQRRLVGESGGR
ncbi:MAG: lysophospholipid acyltransferase family protein [Thermoanaerobaculia bacterium]